MTMRGVDRGTGSCASATARVTGLPSFSTLQTDSSCRRQNLGARRRTAHSERHGGRCRGRLSFCEGPRFWCLAWPCAEANLDWRPDDPKRHQPPRQPIPAHVVRSSARSVLQATKRWPRHVFGHWLAGTAARLHRIALAKLARITSGVLYNDRGYDANFDRPPA